MHISGLETQMKDIEIVVEAHGRRYALPYFDRCGADDAQPLLYAAEV